jgi:glycosyltransferase involved in cell wall biosynthesis
MYLDTVSYLPDDILVKLDRATMGVGLEGRVPYLDHRLVEFAWRVPMSVKLSHPQGKWPLRRVLDRYVPRELTERSKRGFGIPLLSWLRGPLRDWAETLLSERRMRQDGYLNPEPVRRLWKNYLSGSGDRQYALWDILMFQAWIAENHRGPRRTQPLSLGISARSRPIRILHVFGRMDRGGAEMRTMDILRNIDRTKYCFHFLTLTGLPGSLDPEIQALGGEVHRCPLNANFVRSYRKLLRRERYDVVHSHVHFSSGLLLRLAASEGVDTRIAHFRSTIDSPNTNLARVLKRKVMRRWIDQYATKILAVSKGAMSASWGKDWKSEPRCQVIYNGLDLEHFKGETPESVREEFGLSESTRLVIHVGSFSTPKNHFRLLSIFARLHAKEPATRLLIVGRDASGIGDALHRRIGELDLEHAVSMIGERTDVPRLLRAADLMIFPSKWEGLPGAVLEACAAGIPVLASDLPSIREIAAFIPTVRWESLAESDEHWAEIACELLRASRLSDSKESTARTFAASPFTIHRVVAEHAAIFDHARRV